MFLRSIVNIHKILIEIIIRKTELLNILLHLNSNILTRA